jgi:serine phosphatase RsbU (regulator of sigma subunit)/HAMP domain-containing protein
MLRSLSVAKRLYLGFGIIVLATLVAFAFTYNTIYKSKKLNDKINDEINPSMVDLNELQSTLQDLKTLTISWFNAKGPNDNSRNKKVIRIINLDYPKLKKRILNHSNNWDNQEIAALNDVIKGSDSLVKLSDGLIKDFNTLEDYEDAFKMMQYSLTFESGGEVTVLNTKVFEKLRALIILKKIDAETTNTSMTSSFNSLVRLISFLGIVLLLAGILISFLIIRSIVLPVNQLKSSINTMSLGIVPKKKINVLANDEIGQMSGALDNLIQGFERTTVFANEIGQGQFDTNYQPLSDDDTLGQALIFMRDEIKESRRDLEVKVEERTKELQEQKNEVEYLYGQVTDSIKYAKKLQDAILPSQATVDLLLPQAFILYHPKDIVSGDFYWIESKNNKTYFAAVDCTGHGVPGAFMSIVGRNLLKQILSDLIDPQPYEILNHLSKGIADTLNTKDSQAKDGMDLAMCCIDFENRKLSFAGAMNELYLIRDGALQIFDADKVYIGSLDNAHFSYTHHTIDLKTNDALYIFTDGFRDQFGGANGKKFMRKRFNEMFLQHHSLPVQEQRRIYTKTFRNWMGIEEQVDDVLIIGLQIQ